MAGELLVAGAQFGLFFLEGSLRRAYFGAASA